MPFDQNQTSVADNLVVLIGFMPVNNFVKFFVRLLMPLVGYFILCRTCCLSQSIQRGQPSSVLADISKIGMPGYTCWIYCTAAWRS